MEKVSSYFCIHLTHCRPMFLFYPLKMPGNQRFSGGFLTFSWSLERRIGPKWVANLQEDIMNHRTLSHPRLAKNAPVQHNTFT